MNDDSDWFAVVDAAQDPNLHGLILRSRGRVCLFSGDVPPVLAAASPWLVRLRPGEPLFETWRAEGRGRNWGIMCRSPASLEEMRKHFRRFLQAMLPDGTMALFRYYDPRVFNTFIRACTPDERRPWFDKPVLFAVEGATPDILHNYTLRGDALYDADTPI